MSLRLPELPPRDAREALTSWWFSPVAAHLLRAYPRLDEVHLIAFTENGAPRMRLRAGGNARGWERALGRAFERALRAAPEALDDDPVVQRALAAFCPQKGEVKLAVATRGRKVAGGDPKDRSFKPAVEWVGRRLSSEPRPASAPLDPAVAEVLGGLQAADRAERLAIELAEALRAFERGGDMERLRTEVIRLGHERAAAG